MGKESKARKGKKSQSRRSKEPRARQRQRCAGCGEVLAPGAWLVHMARCPELRGRRLQAAAVGDDGERARVRSARRREALKAEIHRFGQKGEAAREALWAKTRDLYAAARPAPPSRPVHKPPSHDFVGEDAQRKDTWSSDIRGRIGKQDYLNDT